MAAQDGNRFSICTGSRVKVRTVEGENPNSSKQKLIDKIE